MHNAAYAIQKLVSSTEQARVPTTRTPLTPLDLVRNTTI